MYILCKKKCIYTVAFDTNRPSYLWWQEVFFILLVSFNGELHGKTFSNLLFPPTQKKIIIILPFNKTIFFGKVKNFRKYFTKSQSLQLLSMDVGLIIRVFVTWTTSVCWFFLLRGVKHWLLLCIAIRNIFHLMQQI